MVVGRERPEGLLAFNTRNGIVFLSVVVVVEKREVGEGGGGAQWRVVGRRWGSGNLVGVEEEEEGGKSQ